MQRVLIAHHWQMFCDALTQALCRRYSVHTCLTGPEVLALTEALHPDILILEMELGFDNAPDLLRSMRCRPREVIVLTCATADRALREVTEAGATAILPLPCTVRLVVDTVESLSCKIPSPG